MFLWLKLTISAMFHSQNQKEEKEVVKVEASMAKTMYYSFIYMCVWVCVYVFTQPPTDIITIKKKTHWFDVSS